ncbi:MAG TPA: MscL family protein [Candidatus Paceibacterota bacterium]
MNGFIDFMRSKGIVGLATGFILGGGISKITASLSNDIINPLVGAALPGVTGDLSNGMITVHGAKVMWGSFAINVIDFLMIALVVYFAVKRFGLERLDKKEDAQ